MTVAVGRVLGWYARALSVGGTLVTLLILLLDQRWLELPASTAVLATLALFLRLGPVRLSKYSYLTQSGIAALGGAVVLGGSTTVAALFAGTLLEAVVLGEEPGTASALKMCYAGWSKASAALLLAIAAAAERLGVADALRAEWEHSIPELPEELARAARSADAKGWRWIGEMREIAATLRSVDEPDGFHEAAAQVFERR